MALTKFNSEQLSVFESQLDDLLAQHEQPAPSTDSTPPDTSNKPSKLSRAAKSVGKVATTATNVAANAAHATRDIFKTPGLGSGGGGIVKKVDLFSPTFDKSSDNTQPSTFVNKNPIEDFKEYSKRVTKGKVATHGTGTPEIDKLLKKLKLLKTDK